MYLNIAYTEKKHILIKGEALVKKTFAIRGNKLF